MKIFYNVTGDIFLAVATTLIGIAIPIRLLGLSWQFGETTLGAITFLKGGLVCLLFSIALNVQDLTKK